MTDALREDVEGMFETERAGIASKISGLVDQVDSHAADMEQRLTALSGDLTERIDRRG